MNAKREQPTNDHADSLQICRIKKSNKNLECHNFTHTGLMQPHLS